jgi:hypothetical protein
MWVKTLVLTHHFPNKSILFRAMILREKIIESWHFGHWNSFGGKTSEKKSKFILL